MFGGKRREALDDEIHVDAGNGQQQEGTGNTHCNGSVRRGRAGGVARLADGMDA